MNESPSEDKLELIDALVSATRASRGLSNTERQEQLAYLRDLRERVVAGSATIGGSR